MHKFLYFPSTYLNFIHRRTHACLLFTYVFFKISTSRDNKIFYQFLDCINKKILDIQQNLPGKRNGNKFEKSMWLIGLARNAVVVITGIILAYWLSVYGYTPFKITGNITEGLPPFGLPPFSSSHNNVTYDFRDMLTIYGSSVVSVPLIALLESIAIAKAFGKSDVHVALLSGIIPYLLEIRAEPPRLLIILENKV